MTELIEEYITLCVQHGEMMEAGNSIKGNKLHSKLTKLISKIECSNETIRSEFYQLYNHSNSSVRLWTSIELLGTFEQKSLECLNEIMTEDGIVSITAKYAPKLWEDGVIQKRNWNIQP